jgi:hypothetical protein
MANRNAATMAAMGTSTELSATLTADPNLDWHDDLEEQEQEQEQMVISRGYQLEMFEKSMQRNIIVTVNSESSMLLHITANFIQMETGSGKTWM